MNKLHIKCAGGCGCGNGYFRNFEEAKARHESDMWAYEMPHTYDPVLVDDSTGKQTRLNRDTGKPLQENTMKKSELKALIREVIEEMGDNNGLGFKVYDPVGNEELKIEKGWEDACDECGDSDGETYYVPSWGGHRCYGCLTHELKKFGYRVEKV